MRTCNTDDLAYQNHFTQLFNTAVDEARHEMAQRQIYQATGDPSRSAMDADPEHVAVRGHCLVWPGWHHLPADLHTLANDPVALEHPNR